MFWMVQFWTLETRQILMCLVLKTHFGLQCVWGLRTDPSLQHSFIYPLIPREEYGLEIEHFITFPFKDQSKGCLRPYLQRGKHTHNSSLCASKTRSENHKQHQGLLTSSHMGIEKRKHPFVDKWPKDIYMCHRVIHFFQQHVCLINTHRTSWPHPANKCER